MVLSSLCFAAGAFLVGCSGPPVNTSTGTSSRPVAAAPSDLAATPRPREGMAIFRVQVDVQSDRLVGRTGRRVYKQDVPVLGVALVEVAHGRATRTRAAHVADFQAEIVDGLAIVSVPATAAGQRYVAADVEVSDDPIDGKAALDCIGGPAPVFEIGPGQVLYVGDYDVLAVSVQGTRFSWRSRFKQDADDAKARIASARPALSSRLQPTRLEWMPSDFGADCVEGPTRSVEMPPTGEAGPGGFGYGSSTPPEPRGNP